MTCHLCESCVNHHFCASLSTSFELLISKMMCWLCLQEAGVVQPAPWEEVFEGPGSGHLTGPASHCAHCHQRYFILLSFFSYLYSSCMQSISSVFPPVITLTARACRLINLSCLSSCSLLEFSGPSTHIHSPQPILHRHAPWTKRLGLSLPLTQKEKICPQNRLEPWHSTLNSCHVPQGLRDTIAGQN